MFRLFLRNSASNRITSERKRILKHLCKKLGIRVRRYEVLDRALTHTSRIDRASDYDESYERLEFLGDSILNASMAYLLFENNPDLTEGGLSALRSSLVDEKTLSEIALKYNILEYVNLGKGETLSDSRARVKVAADIFESVIAVVYLESGFEKALKFVSRMLEREIKNRIKTGTRDYKTKLQKWAIAKFKEYPLYEVVKETGPDHNKIFEMRVSVHSQFTSTANGRTKKEAEQKAAQKVLQEIRTKYPGDRL